MKKTKIDLEDFLKTILPDQKLLKFLSLAQDISKKRGEFLYFAGGVVRDYLLKRLYKKRIPKPKDLDLVLQGNLKSFLKELLEKVKGQILFESQFLTYKVKINLNGKEFLIDFITARKEIYEDIAKLPKVFASHFKDDILRRDFTINALIIGLSPPYEGVLIDLVEGEEDLKKGLIKPLYLNSFVDDPTRIFRGIRYKVRFGFNFSEDFFLALKKCFEKSALKKLSGTRLANELKLYLTKEPEKNLKNLLMTTYELNLFEKAELKIDKKNFNSLIALLKELKGEITEREKEKIFLFGLVDSQFLESLYRLGFPDQEIKELIRYKELIKETLPKWEKLSLWGKIKIFEKIPSTYLLTLGIYFPKIKKDLIKFFKEYRKVKPELTGEELIKLGVKEGKEIGVLLELIRKEKIEGKIKNKEDEKNLVIQFLLKKSKN
jgi:tRNA nucleotidyltransferase (CCA-adding enzyme)